MFISEDKRVLVTNAGRIGRQIEILKDGIEGLTAFKQFTFFNPSAQSEMSVKILELNVELAHWQKQYDSLIKSLR